ncbi:MAG: GFA family protein [Planctomycetota bacterium]
MRFAVRSAHPYPFNLCYCTACRKTAGGGGYAINLSGEFASLRVEGQAHVTVYEPRHVDEHDGKVSPQQRAFCRACGSALWVYDPRWPELVHPHASAIDSELPQPPERTHLMLDFKAGWVPVDLIAAPGDRQFGRYPDESIAAWHARLGLGEGPGEGG